MENMNEDSRDGVRKKYRKQSITQVLIEQGKVPPQATELEEAVLGALMLEKDALTSVIDSLKPEVFYKETHRIIFHAIHNLFKRSEPVDILTVTNELRTLGDLDLVGGPYFITQLTNRIASSANVEYHVKIVTQKFIQRELIRISNEIIRDAYEDTTDVFDLLDKAEKNLFSVSDNNLRRNYQDMQTLVSEAIKEIEASIKDGAHMRGVASGFTELDRVTSGWQKSDLVVLAARPGMGKTAFVLSMARNIAVEYKKAVAFFSLEMSAIQLVTRLISSESELPSEKLKKGNLKNYEWEQLNAKIKDLIDAPLFIDDTPALSIFELRAKSRRLMQQHGISLIIIDYLQLMSAGSDNKNGNREQEISNISRSLKALAKELNIPIIALSQLSRAVETRGGSKKPILSDLRESGAIEQDADIVMFIYRPEYYKIFEFEDGTPTNGIGEIIIAKHRNGALRDVKLRFIEQFAKFAELDALNVEIDDSIPANENFFNEQPTTRIVQSKMNTDQNKDVPF
jgi:replicative DNA helicase